MSISFRTCLVSVCGWQLALEAEITHEFDAMQSYEHNSDHGSNHSTLNTNFLLSVVDGASSSEQQCCCQLATQIAQHLLLLPGLCHVMQVLQRYLTYLPTCPGEVNQQACYMS